MLQDGQVSVSSSCFIGSNATAEIVSDDQATLSQTGNYANSSTTNSACAGVQDVSGNCVAFDANVCTLPSVVFVPPEGGCYADWATLHEAVGQDTDDFELTFRICPNTTLDASSTRLGPLLIDRGIITLQCGKDGLLSSNCTIRGGETFIKVNAGPTVYIHGMVFTDSTLVPILATGSDKAVLSLEDCVFVQNGGKTIILIHNEQSAGDPLAVSDFEYLQRPPEDAGSMTVLIDHCVFEENSVTFVSVLNNGGKLNLIETSFDSNAVSRVSQDCWYGLVWFDMIDC